MSLFSWLFLFLLLLTWRKPQSGAFFAPTVTNQLKGLAILGIVFGHIGYFLIEDTTFLYPLSIIAGVGVNLFLFLSGFGLASSELQRSLSPRNFYRKRLDKLFKPLWLTITAWLLLDYYILQRVYPLREIIGSYVGYFPKADLTTNLNSVLWYFTFILLYYLIFPLTHFKIHPWLAVTIITLLSYLVTIAPLPISQDVQNLYSLHWLAFPLGVAFTLIVKKIYRRPGRFLKNAVVVVSLLVFGYTAVHSNVGEAPWLEQVTSLITTATLVLIFSVGRLNFRLFNIFGLLSYEIYLIHWPLLSRYDIFWQRYSDNQATWLYLVLMTAVGYLIAQVVRIKTSAV